ncbi:MAG: DUF438 domain-containing protein [Eubacteriales bacterium]|nr:DUF438 domain-containing protein [Eubacteriales bacterium]
METVFDQGKEHPESRKEQLMGYLKRLGNGEELESVRADFVKNFGDVDATEIMEAEQALIREGTPLAEVQRLCDVHSALFHGAMMQKKIQEELAKKDSFPQRDYGDKKTRAAELEGIQGHPLYTFSRENEALTGLLAQFRESRSEAVFEAIREISIHYAKKGDLLYPNLKVRHGISGPSDVMWTVDDEIRDELAALARESERGEAWNARLDAVLERAGEMVYKEQNILFPICAINFTEEEWFGVYRDSKDYAVCFDVENERWEEAERNCPARQSSVSDEIVMPGGHMTVEQLTALLNTMPLEISFIDADNINRFFNEGAKVFKRPGMAIDRDVFSCHPPKIEAMVRSIIESFRDGSRDSVPVWMEKGGRTMLVTYMAVRDPDKKYLGTMEIVQDMEFAKAHFQK